MNPTLYAASGLGLSLANPHENTWSSSELGRSRTQVFQTVYRPFTVTVFWVKANFWNLPFVLWIGRRSQALLDELVLSFPLENHRSRSCCIHLQVHLFPFVLNANSLCT